MINSYSTIFALGHPAAAPLMDVPVIIEEKIDGSQFSFMKDAEGNLHMRSKGAQVFEGQGGMFAPAIQTVMEIAPKMLLGAVYRGEFLAKPKHNVLNYARIPKKHIVIFDIERVDGTFFTVNERSMLSGSLGLNSIPYGIYDKLTPEILKDSLQWESILGGTKVEGVVIKPIGYNLYGADKKVLMAKYVSEEFKETHKKEWKQDIGIVEALGTELRTEARWQKAVQHLAEQEVLDHSPKDIGPLIKEVHNDIILEESSYIKDRLLKKFGGDIIRQSTFGLPEWYKKKLMEEQIAVARMEGME